jgi:hypothetical protein
MGGFVCLTGGKRAKTICAARTQKAVRGGNNVAKNVAKNKENTIFPAGKPLIAILLTSTK